jgi:hypothetical protein
MSVSAFTFLTMPLAIACAASIRVGNLLGAQQPKQVGPLTDGTVRSSPPVTDEKAIEIAGCDKLFLGLPLLGVLGVMIIVMYDCWRVFF